MNTGKMMVASGIFTNSSGNDQVQRPYTALMSTASRIRIAVPYFTREDEILQASARGAKIELLVGLNKSTSPSALRKVLDATNCVVRYFTDGFHAKLFLFDGVAMIGSANLTLGGLAGNREAAVLLDQPGDDDRIRDLEVFFAEAWDSAEVLTNQVYKQFKDAWEKSARLTSQDLPFQVLNPVEPQTILMSSQKRSAQQMYLSDLQKSIYEQYKPAFAEVAVLLTDHGHRRPEFADLGIEVEVNRFLNWVRLEHAKGDEAWQNAPLRSKADRQPVVLSFAEAWATTAKPDIPDDYFDLLRELHAVLGSPQSIAGSDREQIASALLCVHAFKEQLRFTRGGEEALPAKFWMLNNDDLTRVAATLIYLVHGTDDFAVRICAVLYDPRYKLGAFGRFCALELVGTLRPGEAPPINGRMAKSLRYLGFDVRAS
jgi:HKD family nuclease